MYYAILYITTAIVFLAVDAVMLKNVLRPLFERHLGDGLAEDFRLIPAAVFYGFYVIGVLWFVSLPALRDENNLTSVFVTGALLGMMCYGTFEFTSYAVMRDWHWHLCAVDTLWGGVLTGLAATAGVAVTRAAS